MRMSVSRLLKYNECRMAYYYHYVLRLESIAQSSNLMFGHCVHEATTTYLIALGKGMRLPDPTQLFGEAYARELSQREITFNQKLDVGALEKVGLHLCKTFPEAWESTGMLVTLDKSGEPLVEREFIISLGDGLEIIIKPDVVANNIDGQVHVLDLKTPAQPSPDGFAQVSEQITTYIMGMDAHASSLGIDSPSWGGFMEGIKKAIPKKNGEGPHWKELELAPVNSRQPFQDLINKYQDTARDIRAGKFHRDPRGAWNTPCTLCEFKGLCHSGSMEGLRERPQRPIAAAA